MQVSNNSREQALRSSFSFTYSSPTLIDTVGGKGGGSGLEFLMSAFDGMCSWDVGEVDEVNCCLSRDSGHKYTPWSLGAPWLCSRAGP